MFSKLLIANRGEIACRVIRTCRRLGIRTVAVYSDADAGARHVREADESVRIGPAAARESYLDARSLVEAAMQTGARALHPGYGFLSEKLDLLDACADADITFIGPHRDAIARMGSKIESKRIARDAGIPCIPGYDGNDQSLERLRVEALAMGFPLLIKASAGGGGKGMKRVDEVAQFGNCLRDARSEAMAAFGNDEVLLERFIARPRHVEVQLLGDRYGNLVHLFERECSVQRHYQKLIEEAPAHHLSETIRARLFDAALALGRRIGYDSTGTVEFVLDADLGDEPYFLEMNTRLQVEHPVTELTTGIDLVEQQIRMAAGEKLSFGQADVKRHGWSIEARINAEVPEEGYRASLGKVTRYREPRVAGVRIDSGIDDRSEITPHYDSMIAKLASVASTRDAALERLIEGLRNFRIQGIRTNQGFLVDLLQRNAFRDVLTTRFLSELFPDGYSAAETATVTLSIAAACGWAALAQKRRERATPLSTLAGFRLTAAAGSMASTRLHVIAGDGSSHIVGVEWTSPRQFLAKLSDRATMVRVTQIIDGEVLLEILARDVHVRVEEDGVAAWSHGIQADFAVVPDVLHAPPSARSAQGDERMVAELPGLVSQILVQTGQEVRTGDPVLILEAMKLFHTLTAPADATVASIAVDVGATVNKGALLVTFDAVRTTPT